MWCVPEVVTVGMLLLLLLLLLLGLCWLVASNLANTAPSGHPCCGSRISYSVSISLGNGWKLPRSFRGLRQDNGGAAWCVLMLCMSAGVTEHRHENKPI